MTIKERITQLRKTLVKDDLFAYIVPSADYHQSEYVADFFKARHYLSGFTGTAGTVVVTQEGAGLWTDGRYFIQAEAQLQGSDITLFKMGEPDVPTIIEYLLNVVPKGGSVGVDGRLVNVNEGKEWENKLKSKQIKLMLTEDLVGEIWEDRPEQATAPAFSLDVKFAGRTIAEKIAQLRADMKKVDATLHILTSLDDLAWLLNMRGHDVKFSPVVQCYSIITLDTIHLFINEAKLDDVLRENFLENKIEILPYEAIYEFVKTMSKAEKVLIDPAKMNYAIYQLLPLEAVKIEGQNPTILAKARKNEIEIANIRKSHLKDGVAFTKFMYWLKTQIEHQEITEISAAEKIEAFRSEQEGYIEPSFKTIAAYKEHGAMMHYSATPETDYQLEKGHLFLIDSGGQYYEGTTDITRTIALGDIDELLKQHFTAVLRGMINLSKAQFLQGVRGMNLDVLARGPIWNLGLDYKCGTGHGVGYLLNVHESPNGFRWRIVPERNDSCELEVGMLTTNEPGIYIEGSHGIRIENELVVEKIRETEYGTFLGFEAVTFAPIDLDAIEVGQMNQEEKAYLNAYHEMVYTRVAPYLEEEEQEWLRVYTRAI